MPPAPPARQRPPAADPSDNTQQRQHDAPAAVHSASTARQTQRTGMQEKRLVALSSVLAAVGLTTFKLVVGLFSGSLGILAEAAHSALDLVAALMTLVAVRVADRPPDETHNYGHAKFENLSAFLEAGLLLLTAAWIIYEAAQRLLFHGGQVDANIWTFLVMGVSIAVDATRSRALMRVAKQQGSQALEADALHFRTDIWSSVVVILGLGAVRLGQAIDVPWLGRADALAALGVSMIVILVSFRLVRQTLDALLDRAPTALVEALEHAAQGVEGVVDVRRVRTRRAGNKLFADLVVGAPRTATFEHAHAVTEAVERAARDTVCATAPQTDVDVVVHVEPAATAAETTAQGIHYLALELGLRAHDVRVRILEDERSTTALEADLHLEVDPGLDLRSAHDAATRLERAIYRAYPAVRRVTTHLEAPDEEVERRRDVSAEQPALVAEVRQIADEVAGPGSCHEVHVYRVMNHAEAPPTAEAPLYDLVLHCTFSGAAPIQQVHVHAEEIERALRAKLPPLGAVLIHTEPQEEAWK
ncbi:MAG TPA: cation diffusion facilitator family transporter [Ktedonobacterales bacterium]|nr:cation diffusion facilitator family transporter [Ktedonobacterales bacterium]